MPETPDSRAWLGRLAAVLLLLTAGLCLATALFVQASSAFVRSTDAPGVAIPSEAAEAPPVEAPSSEAPPVEAPSAEAPLAEAPPAEAPLAEAPLAEALSEGGDAADLLLVQTEAGDIQVMRPDGSAVRALTSDATPQHNYAQPTWAPDARAVAWSERHLNRGATPSTALYYLPLTASVATRADTGPFAPFYIAFSPDAERLAILSNWEGGLAIRVARAGDSGPDTAAAFTSPLVQGRPLYFDWSPDSVHVLAHISERLLQIVDLDGAQVTVTTAAGDFTAPAWLDSGALLYAVETRDGQRLVLGDVAGRVQSVLAEHDGKLTFVASPDGRRVAYAVTRLSVPTNAFGPLSVVDIATGETTVVSREPVLAFFWSPDSGSLAFITPEDTLFEQAAVSQHEDVWLRWHLWDGRRAYPLAPFVPSDTYLLDHLRWFDQYALSATPWAPDSRAFVYAGRGASGASGIWVQRAAPDGAAERVAGGVYAAWSPR